MEDQIDDIEELKRWIAVVVQNSAKADSERLQIAANTLLTGTDQLVSVLASRNAALAKQCRPRNATPPKAASAKGPQQGKGTNSDADTPGTPNGAEDRSEELSQNQRGTDGIMKGRPSMKTQQQLLRQQASGMTPDEAAFHQNAKAIAS